MLDAIQEFRSECLVEGLSDARFGLVVSLRGRVAEAVDRPTLHSRIGPDVRGQDDDRVAKVDGLAGGIREPSVVEDLEEEIRDIRVRLFELVEQDHSEAVLAHRLDEHTRGTRPLRITDQLLETVVVLVLRHVESQHARLAAEQKFGKRLRQLGLSDTRRTDEQERADRSAGIIEPCLVERDGLDDAIERVLLAKDTFVEERTYVCSRHPLGIGEDEHRESGRHREALVDNVRRDDRGATCVGLRRVMDGAFEEVDRLPGLVTIRDEPVGQFDCPVQRRFLESNVAASGEIGSRGRQDRTDAVGRDRVHAKLHEHIAERRHLVEEARDLRLGCLSDNRDAVRLDELLEEVRHRLVCRLAPPNGREVPDVGHVERRAVDRFQLANERRHL